VDRDLGPGELARREIPGLVVVFQRVQVRGVVERALPQLEAEGEAEEEPEEEDQQERMPAGELSQGGGDGHSRLALSLRPNGCPRPWPAQLRFRYSSRILFFWILPVAVLGKDSVNSTRRGHL